jgi:hypothetical protein
MMDAHIHHKQISWTCIELISLPSGTTRNGRLRNTMQNQRRYKFWTRQLLAWNWLRNRLKRLVIRNPKLKWQSPILSRCGADFGLCSLSSTQSFYSGQSPIVPDHTGYPIQFPPYNTKRSEEPSAYLGRFKPTCLGRKYELLSDAIKSYRRLLECGKKRFRIQWSGDPELPYETVDLSDLEYIQNARRRETMIN